MIDPTLTYNIASFVGTTLAGYFTNKGLDLSFASKEKMADELREVIDETVQEYDDRFPQNSGSLLPFYHSPSVIDELLKFSVMHPNEYDQNNLVTVLESETGVMQPNAQNFKDFLEIFKRRIGENTNLEKLEIKETSDQEIFAISRKLDDLRTYMDNLVKAIDGDLQLQWKSRLDAYVRTLADFKPDTALKLIQELEASFATSANKPSKQFLAYLDYQKGICYLFNDEPIASAKSYLVAHKSEPSNLLYKEQAALANFKLDNLDKSIAFANELIQDDDYSIMGWAVRLLSADAAAFTELLDQVPEIITNDSVFLKTLYNMLMNKDKQEHLAILYAKGFVPSFTSYTAFELTINTYHQHLFWILLGLNEYHKRMWIDFRGFTNRDEALILFLNERLKEYFQKVEGSEVGKNNHDFRFLLSFTNFKLTREKSNALEMYKHYQANPGLDYFIPLQCANALQLTGHYPEAISVIEGRDSAEPEILLLLAHCYRRIDDDVNYVKVVKKFLTVVPSIPSNFVFTYLNLIIEIVLFGLAEQFSFDEFITGKSFSSDQEEQLLSLTAKLLLSASPQSETANQLFDLSLSFIDGETLAMISSAFYAAEQFDLAVGSFRRYLRPEIHGRELYQYISSIAATNKDHTELLALLKKWRNEVDFDGGFLLKEAQMRRDLREWPQVVEICKIYLEKVPLHESVMTLYVVALNEIGDQQSVEILAGIADALMNFPFTIPSHVSVVGKILVQQGFAAQGFELLYQHAVDVKNTEVRTAFIHACLNASKSGADLFPMMEYDEVREGTFVKYIRDRSNHFIEMNAEAVSNPIFLKFLGRSPGETVTLKRPMTNQQDVILIKRIMNKYLYLHEEIFNQVTVDPYSGLPFASFTVDPENPGGIFDTLQQMFGESGAIAKMTRQQDIEKYYSYENSLSDVAIHVFQKNYLEAYAALIAGKGITTIPMREFSNLLPEGVSFVLDFSSLLLLHQISMEYGPCYPAKFILSRYIAEHLKHMLREFELDLPTQMTVTISGDDLVGRQIPASYQGNQIAYMRTLLSWVEENCIVELAEKTLEIVKELPLAVGENYVVDCFISSMLLAQENPQRILITDDTFYLKNGLLPINKFVSSEVFIKQAFGLEHACLDVFIQNRYIAFTPSERQLNEQYSKNLSTPCLSYPLCLDNISALNNPANLSTAFKHIKYIVLHAIISPDQMGKDITAVFVGLLRNVNPAIEDNLKAKIRLEFSLLGKKLDLVLDSLEAAYLTLEIIRS